MAKLTQETKEQFILLITSAIEGLISSDAETVECNGDESSVFYTEENINKINELLLDNEYSLTPPLADLEAELLKWV